MKTRLTLLIIGIAISSYATNDSTELNNNSDQMNRYSYENSFLLKKKKKRRGSSDKHFGISPEISYLVPFGLKSSMGFGVRGAYAIGEGKNVINADINFFLPSKTTVEEYAYSLSSTVNPSQIYVNVDYKITAYSVGASFQRYFANSFSDDGFKFYGKVGASAMIFKAVASPQPYNKNDYYILNETTEPEYFSGFVISGAIGLEQSIGSSGALFLDTQLNLPANNVNGQEVEIEIPFSLQLNLGYKIMF